MRLLLPSHSFIHFIVLISFSYDILLFFHVFVCVQRINNTCDISIDLKAESGAAAGRVTLQAKLSQARLEDLVDALPESVVTVTRGQLQILQIDAFDLKGGDADSLFGGKQVNDRCLLASMFAVFIPCIANIE